MFSIIIKNGNLIDGTGARATRADVGICNDYIEAIGDLSTAPTVRSIDATHCVVSPGFIDIHTHSDLTILQDPRGASKIHQGVTTEVVGNCGISPFPVSSDQREERKEFFGRSFQADVAWTWKDLEGYRRGIEQNGTALNIVPMVGHSAIRIEAMGYGRRAPTLNEQGTMERLATEAMEQGAFAFTTGLTLAPSSFADTEEVVAICRAVAARGAFYATHARIWGDNQIGAVQEAAGIGQRARIPVQFSHMSLIGQRNWHRVGEVIEIIDAAREEGVDFTFDIHPYIAAQTSPSQMLPQWVQDGGTSAMVARLKDPGIRKQVTAELSEGWFNGLEWSWDKIVVSNVRSEANRPFIGLTIEEVAEERTEDPMETLLLLIAEEEDYVRLMIFHRSEDDIQEFMAHPYGMIASDGNAIAIDGPLRDSRPHPRFYGTFPRVLGHYARDRKLFSLEEAIHKMTGFPASRLGLPDRGRIRVGAKADLVVFDPESIAERSTYNNPHQYATGIEYVLVNGKLVLDGGQHTGATPGHVLRPQ